ncbi:N-acetylneuraminate lyase [Gadus macrocephalus]|uniref:N-acetylneuraminate lyase n=1 Tax=Gadus macrocephalus TaxID=80720 RepID=UPI0028CB58C7|nr:N-acetylneuraminate lyase [Gadus macrocephalus]
MKRITSNFDTMSTPQTGPVSPTEMASRLPVKLTGLVAATFTPLTSEGELDLSVIGPYVDYLTERQGVWNIFVNGTTGEGMSLSVEERKRTAEEWCLRARGKMDNVIVHVGCLSIKDSKDLAHHAETVGADGIGVISPSFFKPKTADALRSYLKEVASAAPALPLYYYHIPALTGSNLLASDVCKGLEALIPTFSGVKFSGTDLMDFGQCVRHSQADQSLLYGVDEQLLAALAFGANGAVGSLYNYLGSHFNKLMMAFAQGDLVGARALQFSVQDLLAFASKYGFDVAVNKQLMSDLSGLSLGPPRLPLVPCRPEIAAAVAQKYHQIFPEP